MSLPKLRCPNDGSHSDFCGSLNAYVRYRVDLAPDRTVRKRHDSVDLHYASAPSDDAIYCTACNVEVWSKPRAISFSPLEGTVLICDFSVGFRPPEMCEKRPCVVVSKQRTNRGLCVVVPISSTESTNPRAISVALPRSKYAFLQRDSWAKCHAPATVAVGRLSMMRDAFTGRGVDSRKTMLDPEDLAAVRQGVARFIGVLADPS